ncbi:MAG: PqqD family protein [Clostridia bacterium]|nr:PqqD family protein [Clostridia bacterium]
MKINKGFLMREVAGENVVIAVGEAAKSFKGMIHLNPTGAFLWKLLEKDTDEAAMLSAMLDAYETDKETAENDIRAFVGSIRAAGLLDE